jgi:hypothetical protein
MARTPSFTPAGNPFDILPAQLFNPLGAHGEAGLQRHYVAVLLRLYGLAEFNRFGLTREVAIGEIVAYLRDQDDVAAAIEAEMAAEEGGRRGSGGRVTSGLDLQNNAGYLLRRLVACGWIEREHHADYTETVVLPDYAFTLLEALRGIQEQKPREYTGQLYTAHQLLTRPGKDFSPALALTQAYENVRQVVRGLNELNHNIRRYTEHATRGRDVKELLRLHYEEYAQLLGPAYHALKTSDHVSRYRRDIVDQLRRWQHSPKWLDGAAADLVNQGRLGPAEAVAEIRHAMHFIVAQLEGLDPLIDEIDRRHLQYLRTSLRQIQYQLVSADGGFKDRLVAMGRDIAALIEAGHTGWPAGAGGEAPPTLLSFTVAAPDRGSFYVPPRHRQPFHPAPVLTPALSGGELIALRRLVLSGVIESLSPARVDRLVMALLGEADAVHLHDFPDWLSQDLPRLATVAAYGYHPEVRYGVEPAEGEPLAVGRFRVAPFALVRR